MYVSGVLTATTVALAKLQAAALRRVDSAAESARSQWITLGVGQSQEYNYTLQEAMAANAAADPLDGSSYPWLQAELDAQIAAGDTTATLRTVVADVMGKVAAWQTAGVTIKQTRRTAKLAILAATNAEAVNAVLSGLSWPVKS
jgi:hypothetical protein